MRSSRAVEDLALGVSHANSEHTGSAAMAARGEIVAGLVLISAALHASVSVWKFALMHGQAPDEWENC